MKQLHASIRSILSGDSVSSVVQALVEDDAADAKRAKDTERVRRKRAAIHADPEAYAAYLERNRAYQRSKDRRPINKNKRERMAKLPQDKKDTLKRQHREARRERFSDPDVGKARATDLRARSREVKGRVCASCGLSDDAYTKAGKRYGPNPRCDSCLVRGRKYGWCVNKVHCLPPSPEKLKVVGRPPRNYPKCNCTSGKVDPDYTDETKKLRPRIPLKPEVWTSKPIRELKPVRKSEKTPIRKNMRGKQVFRWKGLDSTLDRIAMDTDLSIDKLRHYLVDKRMSVEDAIKAIEDKWRTEIYHRAKQVRSERKPPGEE